MEGKKISFGFMKTKKADKPVVEEKKDFIECLEEKSIKVVGGEQIEEKAPLVITLKPNTLITAERLRKIAEEVEGPLHEPEIKIEKVDQTNDVKKEETLEQMAIRELLQDAKKEVKVESNLYSVPIPSQPALDGQKESTLDDYESVPIQEFGLAMLRGMGWAPGKEQSKLKEPQLRPKGLGLGADKVIKKKETKTEKDGKELAVVANAFVKVINGKHSGYYGKVVSLDEDTGRALVQLAVQKQVASFGEFMLQPVSKAEFDRESRVINADKFEEYKKSESAPQKSQKHDSPKPNAAHSSRSRREERQDEDRSEKTARREDKSANGRNRAFSVRSEDKTRRRDRRYSSQESLSSSDSDRRKKEKPKKRDSTDSDSPPDRRKKKNKHRSKSPGEKRDSDKKRKGKKKRRDRDRSPNYRKHRK